MAGEDYVIKVIMQAVDQVTAPLNKLTAQLGNLKHLIIGSLGIFAIHEFIKNIEEAEEATHRLELSVERMGANAGRTTEEITRLANEIQRTTRFTDEAAKEAAVKLLRYNKITGDSFDRALKLSADMAESLRTDLAGAARIVGIALQDPARGMMLLRRAGIVLSADMRKVIVDLVKTGKTAQAQQIIFQELEKRVGGFASAARNTLSGALTGLQNQVRELFEGDSSAFGQATKAINDLTTRLQDPALKEGINGFISLLIDLAGAAATAAAKIGDLYTSTTKFIAARAIDRYSKSLQENLRDQAAYVQQIDKLKGQLATASPEAKAWFQQTYLDPVEKKLAELQSWEQVLRKAIAGNQAALDSASGKMYLNEGRPDPRGRYAKPSTDTGVPDEEELKKLQELRSSVLAGIDKVTAEWADTEKKIAEAVKAGVLNAQEQQNALAALRDSIRQAVLPQELLIGGDTAGKLEALTEAYRRGAISAEEFGQAIRYINDRAAGSALPKMTQELNEWNAQLLEVENALKNVSGYTTEIANQRIGEIISEHLQPIEITAQRINLEPLKKEVSEFAIQAQRELQTFFTNAFMNVGKGWKDLLHNMLMGFAQIFAEMASMNLLKALGIEDYVKGSSTKGIGKLLSAVFGGGSGEKGAGAGQVDTGVDSRTGTAAAETCASTCAGEVAKQVATATSGTVGAELKSFGDRMTSFLQSVGGGLKDLGKTMWSWIKDIGSGFLKLISGVLDKIWSFITSAIKAIQGITASSSAGSGSSGGIIGGIISIGSALFAAGGGRTSAGRATIVGEDGPEVIYSASPMNVRNRRQLAFAGGGGQMNYAPTYNVTITGAKDDKELFAAVATFVERKDQKNKVEMMEMLRRNGFGRMKR